MKSVKNYVYKNVYDISKNIKIHKKMLIMRAVNFGLGSIFLYTLDAKLNTIERIRNIMHGETVYENVTKKS